MSVFSKSRFALLGVLFLLGIAVLLSTLLHVEIHEGSPRLSLANLKTLSAWLASDSFENKIFWKLQLPRLLGGLLVGGGLAAAGTAFQATLRNPLAEPYTLGISAGAALAAVIAIRFGFDQSILGATGVGFAALLGALTTVYMVWKIAAVGDRLPPATLLLAGITVAMFCGASTMAVQYTANVHEVYRMVRWMMGGLGGVTWPALYFAGPATLLGILILTWLGRDFNALAAGSDAAMSLGTNAKAVVTLSFASCALLVGAGIAIAGPIGFIGLIIPHIMRALIGPDHRKLVPISALAGAAVLVLCDLLARALLFPAELPVGILTALFGGPFFLTLLVREKSKGSLWGG